LRAPLIVKPFLVQEFADPADQQHFVMLVVAPVAAALHRLQSA
jgi:hypothetical protein